MSSYLDKTGLERFWAAIKSKFAPKDRGVQYIRGTWTAATGTWTGVSKDSELYDGKQIILYMPFGGSGNATLNLTLANGTTTGAKNVYFEGTTRFTTHKGQNSQLPLIYHSGLKLSNGTAYEGWWYLNNRDTTINWQMRHSSAVKAKEAIPQYHLCGGTDEGYVKIVSGATFDISYPLLITQSAWTAGSTHGDGFFEYQDQNIRSTITALGSSYTGLTAYKMIYLVGVLDGTNFTVDSSLVTCTQPTSDNGKAYIPLGIAYSTYQFYFYSQRHVYGFRNGKFQELSFYADTAGNATKVNNHTVNADVPSGAKFTDTTYTAATAAPGNVASSSSIGTSTNYARQDHTHGIDLVTGDANGQVKIAGTNVSVKGWNNAATYDVQSILANDTKLPTGAAVTTALNKYLPLTGGTLTGELTLHSTSSISDDKPATISFKTTQSDNSVTTDNSFIKVYDDHDAAANGTNMVIQSAGNVIIGGGESPSAAYTTDLKSSQSENLYLTSDSNIYFYPNAQTYANHKSLYIDTNGDFKGARYIKASYFTQTSSAETPTTSSYLMYANSDGFLRKSTLANVKTILGMKDAAGYEVETAVANDAKLPTGAAVKSFVEGKGYVTTDTKNTTGSTDTSSKIFLIGATSQAANPQTYSDNEIYATSGVLTTKSVQVGGTAATMQYNSATSAIDFIFD